ncbi:hypothetical protein MANES_12G119601v8 [Manihot esculenta]|uniref:Uncharacterized protein n=1 Tax=Manihot esculenta TaxID=3983 RepID=A0ACB7GR54_MANES|nr:hypothetical protein MANES_12G119601v8 [Manihot esculenta]
MKKEAIVAAVTAVGTVAGVIASMMEYKRRKGKQKEIQRILRKFAGECATPVPKLWEVANALVSEMETSLISSQEPSTLKMLVSSVTSLPSGSPDMAAMHQDTSEDHQVVAEKLKEIFGITDSTPMARKVVAEVCDIVAERGARLAGAGIVGIIKKLGRVENKSIVNVEGLYEHYQVFRNYLHSSLWEMLGNDQSDNVILEHSHGGSGAGALFLASCQTHTPDS